MVDTSLAARIVALNPAAMNFAGNPAARLVTGTGADWFGPLAPLVPIAPKEVAGRQLDFPPGYNLVTQPRAYEPISFWDLRSLADGYDVMRLIIETRKDQMARLQWNVRPRKETESANADSDPRITKLEAFFRRPDGVNYWDTWLRCGLEDLFVIDAPAYWCERNRGGALLHLHPIDGATIKRVIDDWGRTPQPPIPAYQQVLHGMPAVDYTTRDILYRPRNHRANRVYGYSPVEQSMMTINIALRRQIFQLQYYSEGNIPEALIGTPDNWTTDEIRKFQTWWDTMLAGNTAERRHAKFVPGGVAKTYIPTKEAELTGAMDEWLVRVVCFAFSISPQPFIKMVNRGNQESMQETAIQEGLAPIQQWVKQLIDEVIEVEFQAPDLEFKWKDEHEIDPTQVANNAKTFISCGTKTVNEVRQEMGFDPMDGGDDLVYLTATGPIPVDADTRAAEAEANKPPPPVIAPPLPDATGVHLAPTAKPDPAGAQPPEKPPAKPKAKEVGKEADGPFAKADDDTDGDVDALPRDDETVTRQQKILAAALFATFRTLAPAAAAQVDAIIARRTLTITPDDALLAVEAQSVVDDLDLDWSAVVEPAQDALGAVGNAASRHVIAQVGAPEHDALVNQVATDALDYARARAAEMVGMKYDADGALVANPNAKYAITDTTRDAIKQLVVKALSPLEDGEKPTDLAAAIQDAGAFSKARADSIALTEIGNAHGTGTFASLRAAAATGVRLKKKWTTAGDIDVDTICIVNALVGAIPLEMPFPSGNLAPLAHPRCRCVLTGVTE